MYIIVLRTGLCSFFLRKFAIKLHPLDDLFPACFKLEHSIEHMSN